MALTPRVPGSPFHVLEAAVRDVRLNLPAAGGFSHTQTCHKGIDGGGLTQRADSKTAVGD